MILRFLQVAEPYRDYLSHYCSSSRSQQIDAINHFELRNFATVDYSQFYSFHRDAANYQLLVPIGIVVAMLHLDLPGEADEMGQMQVDSVLEVVNERPSDAHELDAADFLADVDNGQTIAHVAAESAGGCAAAAAAVAFVIGGFLPVQAGYLQADFGDAEVVFPVVGQATTDVGSVVAAGEIGGGIAFAAHVGAVVVQAAAVVRTVAVAQLVGQ